MKVCILSARFYPQIVGSGTTAYMYAKGLHDRGHQVTVITDETIKDLLGDEQMPFGVRYIPGLEGFAMGRVSFKQPADDLYSVIKKMDFDVLHVNNFMQMLLVSLFRPLIGKPVVFSFYNTPNGSKRAMGYFDSADLDLALARNIIGQKQYDRLVVGSKCYRDFALDLGADGSITEFEYLGIDHEQFEKSIQESAGTDLGQYFGGKLNSGFIFMLPGRIVLRKGILEAVKALAIVRKKYPAKLVLTGLAMPFDADFGSQIMKEAKRLGVDEAIIGPDKVISRNDLPALYKRSDVVLVPSYYEGLGLTAIEALKTGRSLIVTKAPGLDEVGIHEQNAVVVSPKDDRELAEAMIRLIEDAELRKRLEKAGPESSKRFDNAAYVKRLEEIYKEVQK